MGKCSGFFVACFFIVAVVFSLPGYIEAANLQPQISSSVTLSISPTPSLNPTATPRPVESVSQDLTQKSVETIGSLEKLLSNQTIGPVWPFNPIKHAIRNAVTAGVPANTIALLLLLPGAAALIAAARHLIGIRGFGIFLPAALSVVFVATGPIVGIGLFLIIVIVSTLVRLILRKTKIKLQYLPRMALLLLVVVLAILGILFLTPLLPWTDLTNVSIFPVLILVLLAEDFIRVQLGKNIRVAINLATETLILALSSYLFLTLLIVQHFALLHPESYILTIAIFDFVLGKYGGLRFLEYWRFRKLINS